MKDRLRSRCQGINKFFAWNNNIAPNMACCANCHYTTPRCARVTPNLSYCLSVRLYLFQTCLVYGCNAVFRLTQRYIVKKLLIDVAQDRHITASVLYTLLSLFFMVFKFSFPMFLLYLSYIKVLRFDFSKSPFFVIHLTVLPFGHNKQRAYFLLALKNVTIVLHQIYGPVLYISFISQKT